MKRKAIAMFSGGLDSILATLVVKEQGVEVIAFHLASVFCKSTFEGGVHPDVVAAADEIGVELHVESSSDGMLEMVKNPRYGFGKNLNPCIDCRMNTILQADKFRQKVGADFLITGEVLGQRPMSQNRGSIELIDRKTELEDILLRPLCAFRLNPTLPEREGWVNREAFPQITGRSRSIQLQLAKEFNITKYGSPAGGCYLTEIPFCKKLKDLLAINSSPSFDDIRLLKIGRHFRISDSVRVVMGRDHAENQLLEKLHGKNDIILQASQNPGSIAFLRNHGEDAITEDEIIKAAGLAVFYSRNRDKICEDVEKRSCGQMYSEGEILKDVPVLNQKEFENIVNC